MTDKPATDLSTATFEELWEEIKKRCDGPAILLGHRPLRDGTRAYMVCGMNEQTHVDIKGLLDMAMVKWHTVARQTFTFPSVDDGEVL